MNEKIALLSIIELLSALSCGVLILFITFRILRMYGEKKLGITHANTAYNIVIAGVLFIVGYILTGVIEPILNVFRLMSNSEQSSTVLLLKFLSFGGISIAIAYILSMLVSLLGVKLFTWMTPVNELNEIKMNNIGMAIVLATIIIVLGLFVKGGIILFIESMIPYPELPPF